MGEEAVEVALAAVKGDHEHLKLEAADLFYHLIVLLEASGLPVAEVMAELEKRVGTGGHYRKSRAQAGVSMDSLRQDISPYLEFSRVRLGEAARRHADDPDAGGRRRIARPQ